MDNIGRKGLEHRIGPADNRFSRQGVGGRDFAVLNYTNALAPPQATCRLAKIPKKRSSERFPPDDSGFLCAGTKETQHNRQKKRRTSMMEAGKREEKQKGIKDY